MWLKISLIACLVNFVQFSLALDLEEKVANLFSITSKQGIIRLDSDKFETYVRSRPRNYSVIAMTTALNPSRGCSVCHEAYNEYKILYNSYRQNSRQAFLDKGVFFALIDYDDASDVFNQLKLNSAPGFFHFPDSNTKTSKADKLDLNKVGFQASSLANWVKDRTALEISVVRPPSYTTFVILFFFAAVTIFLAFYSGIDFEFLYNTRIWAMGAISIVLLMISGQMWNHIRGPPPMGRTQRGLAFIAPTSQQQFVFETYWVAMMYAACSLGVILLGDHAADESKDKTARRSFAMIGIAIFAVVYSLILATFRQKYQGYPYKLLF